MTVKLSSDGTYIFYHSKTFASGMLAKWLTGEIISNSVAQYNAQGTIIPLQYDYKISNQPSDNKKYQFDWQQRRGAVTYKGKDYELALVDGTVDENTLILRLMQDVAVFGAKLDKTYRVLTRGKIKERRFAFVDNERIETVFGKIDTLKIERQKRGETDRLLWLSPSHAFVPVKIVFLKNGKKKQTLSIAELTLQRSRR